METQDINEEKPNWQDQFNFDNIPRDVHDTTELYQKHQQMSNNATILHLHEQTQTTKNERPSKKSRPALPKKLTTPSYITNVPIATGTIWFKATSENTFIISTPENLTTIFHQLRLQWSIT